MVHSILEFLKHQRPFFFVDKDVHSDSLKIQCYYLFVFHNSVVIILCILFYVFLILDFLYYVQPGKECCFAKRFALIIFLFNARLHGQFFYGDSEAA